MVNRSSLEDEEAPAVEKSALQLHVDGDMEDASSGTTGGGAGDGEGSRVRFGLSGGSAEAKLGGGDEDDEADEDEPLLGDELEVGANNRHRLDMVPKMTAREVFAELDVNPRTGLRTSEAERRRAVFGPNELPDEEKGNTCVLFMAHFTHLMALLLWAAGVLAYGVDMPELCVAIWLVNIINGSFSFYQEFKADKATEALKRRLPSYARVLRDGVETKVLAAEVVPGDIMVLDEGDLISADARLVQSAGVTVDQANFTGETMPVSKEHEPMPENSSPDAENDNLVFASTTMLGGTARAVVLRTGANTRFGLVAKETRETETRLSPLQQDMELATKYISVIAISFGLVFFLMSYLVAHVQLAHAFIFALGMVVAFVPEGLLPTVTLSLARGTLRMANRGAIVKRMSAVETLGCTSVICTDKTGTVTQNKICVSTVWMAGDSFNVSGLGYAPDNGTVARRSGASANGRDLDREHVRLLAAAGSLCNKAKLVRPENDEHGEWSKLGDPTEAALLVLAAKCGVDVAREELRTPLIHEVAFTSRRMRMTTVHSVLRKLEAPGSRGRSRANSERKEEEDGEKSGAGAGGDEMGTPLSELIYCKGAPGVVLELCTQARWHDGELVPLTAELRRQIIQANEGMAAKGERVLGMAYRARAATPGVKPLVGGGISGEPGNAFETAELESDLVFLGLAAMSDPPRVGVTEAFATCRRAGIRVIMITGDNGLTAQSIAYAIGLIPKDEEARVITGSMVEAMTAEELQAELRDTENIIFARAKPTHKLLIVTAVQELGLTVAVTGDGVNDAPALKKADIGVAMGRGGTDVAMEAAEIILTDNNFASIVFAIEEGRAVYDNIKKFLTYILSSNMAEAFPFMFFVITAGKIPLALTVMVVLAIDLGTDMIPALALGADPPAPGTMDRPPRLRNEHFFQPSLIMRSLFFLGIIEGACAMFAFFLHMHLSGLDSWLSLPLSGDVYEAGVSMAFAAVVFCQVANVFICRSERESAFSISPFNNTLLWVGLLFEIGFAALIIFVPVVNAITHTKPVPIYPNILLLLLVIPFMISASEIRKYFVRKWYPEVKGAQNSQQQRQMNEDAAEAAGPRGHLAIKVE